MIETDLKVKQVKKTNVWSKAIGFITLGLILTTLRMDQYILPSLGVILIFLGFHSLRNENIYFKIAWVLSIVKIFEHLSDLIWLAKLLNGMEPSAMLTVGILKTIFQIAILLVFHAALKKTYKSAGSRAKGIPLIWISLWTVVVFILTIFQLCQNLFIFIPVMMVYMVIMQALYRTGKHLDSTGYVFKNTAEKNKS
jgi:hypothetical protein